MSTERKTNCKNLAAFVSTKPPCVVFFISLSIFAVGFFVLGYYVQHHDIVDLEVSQSWDNVYKLLSNLKFCINSTNTESKKKNNSLPMFFGYHRFMVNISLPFEVIVRPRPDSQPLNVSQIAGILPLSSFKFTGIDYFVYESPIWISLEPNTIMGPCIVEEEDARAKCREMTFPICATFMLPKEIVKSETALKCRNNISLSLNTASMYTVPPQQPYGQKRRTDQASCTGEIELKLQKQTQYQTDVLLSITEKTRVNLRLQMAGYFLFVMILSFAMFTALRRRSSKSLKRLSHE